MVHLDGNSVRGTDVSVLGSSASNQDIRLDNNLLDTAVDFGAVQHSTGQNVISGKAIVIPNTAAPSSSTAAGQPGEMRIDGTHVYACVAANQWVKFGATF